MNKIESIEHTFLVQNIKSVLSKYIKNIKVNIVRGPDLVYEESRGYTAIEVESGIKFGLHKLRLKNKFNEVSRVYSRVIIIVINSKDKIYYKRLLRGLDNIEIINRHEVLNLVKGRRKLK